jgi:hypothetical protein
MSARRKRADDHRSRKLVAILKTNLKQASEPELVARLRAALKRLGKMQR